MPNPPKPPEPKPAALRFSARDVKFILSSPSFVLFALVLAMVPGLVPILVHRPEPAAVAPPDVVPSWSVNMAPSAFSALTQEVVRALPSPIDSQRLPPCDHDLEREIKGACWVPVDVERCPPGKAYVNDDGAKADGKCYARAMRAARTPTSGDVRHAGVAGP